MTSYMLNCLPDVVTISKDDDLHVSASAIEFMFRVWKSVGQRDHRIVGRVARLATRDPTGSLVYRPYPQDTYNLVLTGLAFMDKTMSQWYWEDDPLLEEARKHVDVATNCEDILMNCELISLGIPLRLIYLRVTFNRRYSSENRVGALCSIRAPCRQTSSSNFRNIFARGTRHKPNHVPAEV